MEKIQKINDGEIAKYAEFFNRLCKKNKITSFWWDTSLLVDRKNLTCLDKVVKAIMNVFPEASYVKKSQGYVEEAASTSVRNMKVGWNLGNTLDANKYQAIWNKESQLFEEKYEAYGLSTEILWHEEKTTREIISYVKSLGFNAVRLPVTWAGHIDFNGRIAPEWMNRVKEIADYIIAEGMYCIVNVHHDGGAFGWIRACEKSYEQFSSRLANIYSQLGETFKDYDERLLFEGVNEILDENSSWADPSDNAKIWINKWNQLFVDTIRQTGGNNLTRNLIIMAGAGKSSRGALKNFKIPEDSAKNHLIFEFHNYDPQSFCWHSNPSNPDPDETPYWNEEKHTALLEKDFDEMLTALKEFNIPVICGEYAAWPKKLPE